MKIPVTLLSSYLYCPRKLFLEKVLELSEPPKESLVLGTIRHEAYDMINKSEQDIVSCIEKGTTLEELRIRYKQTYFKILRKIVLSNRKEIEQVGMNLIDAYRKAISYISEEAEIRSSNVHSFVSKYNIYGDELWFRLTPKIISELRVESQSLRLKGIVDQVHVYEEGHVPFELKTGKAPLDGVWPGHRIQLAAYSLLLAEHFKKPIKEGFVYYLDIGQKRQVAMNPFMRDEVSMVVSQVIELLEKIDVPSFCNNQNKCRKCGLRSSCYDEAKIDSLLKVKIASLGTIYS